MRLLTKAAIFLFTLYAAFLGLVVVWMDHSVRTVSESLLKNTARLLGNDIAAALTKTAIEDLRIADVGARQRLVETITDVTSRSEVVASLSVVDATGKVVASDEEDIGRQVAGPNLIFTGPGRLKRGESDLIQQDGTFFLFVPLIDRQDIVGYLRLALNGEPLHVTYKRARRDFSVIAGCGLLAVLAVLGWLRLALVRRRASLLESFELAAASRFEAAEPTSDELWDVEEAARRMRAQLTLATQRATLAEAQLAAIERLGATPVAILRADRSLLAATQQARDLFGDAAPGELEKRWNEIQALLEEAWDTAPMVGPIRRLAVDLADTKPPRTLRLDVLALVENGQLGYLVWVRDSTLGACIAADLSAALELYTLHGIGLQAAASAATLAQDIDASLQGLRESFEDDSAATPSKHEQQTEFVDSIEDAVAAANDLVHSLAKRLHPRVPVPTAFDLQETLVDLLDLAGPTAKARRIRLSLDPTSLPVLLGGSHWSLRDAVLNLLLHALDWMPEGTHIEAKTERDVAELSVTLRCSAASDLSADSWQLYEPYLIDEQGTARLGLAIARQAIEALGGQLRIFSNPDGTSYRLTVPLAHKPSLPRAEAMSS